MSLNVNNLTMQFGAKPLFENVSIKFSSGNRYGLIGANGSGKSTFMRILSGDLDASSGNVEIPDGVRVGKLRQNQFAYEDQRVIDVILQGHEELWAILQEKDAIYANPEATEEDYMRAGELEAQFAEFDGYTAEAKASELLLSVGIDLSFHQQNMSAVAPGWKLRVLLAQALFSDPDVLLLDEPTNNLDIHTITWLKDTLNARNSTMIIISHDRHFLNSVCTHMADLDYSTIRVYPGNYDDYMEAATMAQQRLLQANSKAKEKIQELQDFVRRFSANKSKARQATSRQKQLEKIKVEDIKPSSRQTPFIRFEITKVLHRQAVEINKLRKGFDHNLFQGFSALVEAGEKIAIVGGNGVGKSTLMKILAGVMSGDSGNIKWAEHAQIGYYAQDHEYEFEKNLVLTDWMTQFKKEQDDDQVIRSILGRLLFSGDDALKTVQVLSGGEKGRMIYGRLMLEKNNVLLMDEPTNHMDMESIEALNIALEKYPGTLLFVSHDRQFVASLATRVWEIKDGKIYDYPGNYDDYLAALLVEQEKNKKK